MNTAFTTGWLIKPGTKAYTTSGRPKLAFEIMIAGDPGDEPTPWHCEIENPALIEKAEDLLAPGRSVAITAKLCGRPFKQRDIQKGFSRYLRVLDIEFVKPDRGAIAEPTEEPAQA